MLAQLPSTPQDELVITAYKHIQNHMYAESEEAIVAALATNNGDDDEITASPSLSSEFAHLAYELRGTYEFLKGNGKYESCKFILYPTTPNRL